MVVEHLSHWGLEKIRESEYRVTFQGDFVSCKRMAIAHGCSVAKSENNSHALFDYHGEHAGWIMNTEMGWNLMLDQRVWKRG